MVWGVRERVHTSPYSPSIQISAALPEGSGTESRLVGRRGRITSTMFSN